MPVKIFFCYAHQDEELLNKLKAHLKPLQRQGHIDVWHDRDIGAGTEWEQEIKKQLNTADIILLLVSPDFMNSDYINDVELKKAIERHARGEARVIPIMLRRVYWQGAPFGKLQALPTDAQPVRSWPDLDDAFFNITEGISTVAKEMLVKQYLVRAKGLFDENQLDAAVVLYEKIINLIPNCVDAYAGKGASLWYLNRYREALDAYDQAISVEPHNSGLYVWKAKILVSLNRYEEALAASEHAIRSSTASDDKGMAELYDYKGYLLEQLKRSEEALNAYDVANQFRRKPPPQSGISPSKMK